MLSGRRARRFVLLGAAVLLAAVAPGGCAAPSRGERKAASIERAPAADLAALRARLPELVPALVRLYSPAGGKRGAIIDPGGLVLSCGHGSVPGGRELIVFSDGSLGFGVVLGVAPEADLALLRIVSPRRARFASLVLAPSVAPGDWVYLVQVLSPDVELLELASRRTLAAAPQAAAGGSEGAREHEPVLELAAGRVQLVDLAAVMGRSRRYLAPALMVHGLPAFPGESGSPLLNARGELVGIASMGGADRVAGVAATSLNGIRRWLPQLASGGEVGGAADGRARLEACLASLRHNAALLLREMRETLAGREGGGIASAGAAGPNGELTARERAVLDELERRVRARWGPATTLTRDMCIAGLEELVHVLQSVASAGAEALVR
ncbi:MAG: hypothetical protein KatS3mg102_2417 [Planctomycetota bacterium]|nr:MAG: hypothetical protein KatS3mg102_2417 [Planctomycetota bacterium]